MTKILVKIAKELNVGTTTIVDFLTQKGFEIENRPTFKVSEEMYKELLKEFQQAIAIKEQADQLVIGNRPGKKEEEPTPEKPAAEKLEKPVQKTEKIEQPPKAESVEEKIEKEESAKPKLKILGKINLEPAKKKKTTTSSKEASSTKKSAEPSKKEAPVTEKATPKETTPPAPKKEVITEAPKVEKPTAPVEENIHQTEKPELRGLKILGKIDANKFDSKKSKKEEPKETAASTPKTTGKPATTSGESSAAEDAKKRKRKRKRVSVESSGAGNRQAQGPNGKGSLKKGKGKEDELKEVSQKEIDEKIKATMARLSGGGKKKGQKLRREKRERLREKQEEKELELENEKLQLTEFISVQELANLMNVDATDVITTCMNLGIIVSINQRLDAEVIELVAGEFDHEVEFISMEEQTDGEEEEIEDDPAELVHRAPIVTVMGHVDHGKTSLLDYVREANVASGEAGGITQHIGAYEVKVGPDKKGITFLDTPGHEAFTAMRARGAKVTDIAVIIIAADDSIMPQTKEAISHAQAAGVPIIFAINKIDKPGANPERIKQDLASMNFLVEDWGGTYQSQDISAHSGEGIDGLLEKILLEAEVLDLKANPKKKAVGTLLEASLDKGRGYVTKILVQNGTLKIGDPMVSGDFSGKIKAMFNERNKRIKEAGPSQPVMVLGLDGAPQAGEKFKIVESEQEARGIANKRAQISREQANRATKRISLDEIGRRLALGTFKELNLIVKGDVDGSIEALSDSLIKLSQETVIVNVIHKAVGQIIESDVLLASASDAIIIGFQVRPSLGARQLAEKEGVEIKLYSIIYKAIEEIKAAIEGMLEPTKEENILGQAEVREVYKISKIGTIAGCYVQEGKILRNSRIRLIRDGIVIFPTKEGQHGEISSLKRFKEDAKEVRQGLECGISVKNFNDIKVGDVIEGYEIVEVKQKLEN
jgi:translation initiation factor IF-2